MRLEEALKILKEKHYIVEEEIIQLCDETIAELEASDSSEIQLGFDTEEERYLATDYLDSIFYNWDYCEGIDDEPTIAIYRKG